MDLTKAFCWRSTFLFLLSMLPFSTWRDNCTVTICSLRIPLTSHCGLGSERLIPNPTVYRQLLKQWKLETTIPYCHRLRSLRKSVMIRSVWSQLDTLLCQTKPTSKRFRAISDVGCFNWGEKLTFRWRFRDKVMQTYGNTLYQIIRSLL